MKNKENLIVDKEEVENEVKSSTKKNLDISDEPKWYHYVIVLLAFFGFFALIYAAFEVYDGFMGPQVTPIDNISTEDNNSTNGSNILVQTYVYEHKVGNITYNLHMHTPISDLEDLDIVVEPDKLDILNSRELIFSFMDYTGEDNGKVTVASSKLVSFFKNVYHFSFNDSNFKMVNESNCQTSTKSFKSVLMNPYSNESGVFYDSTSGCIEVMATSPQELITVSDKFIYELVENG